jgi:hypothetical protein
MTDLHDLLERSVGAVGPGDVAADLRRGHSALRRHHRQSRLTGALGLAVVAVGATALQQQTGTTPLAQADGSASVATAASSATTASAEARLLSSGGLAGRLTIRPVGPQENRYYVGRAHSGAGDATFARLRIVDAGPAAGTHTVSYQGRTFYQETDASGATVLWVQDSHALWLRLTTPSTMGWSLHEQLRILASSGTAVRDRAG